MASDVISYLGGVVNYVVIGFAIFVMPYAVPNLAEGDSATRAMNISNVSFVCLMLASGFSQFVNISKQLADVAGYTARVATLLETMDANDKHEEELFTSKPVITATELSIAPQKPWLSFQDVTVQAPDGSNLIERMILL